MHLKTQNASFIHTCTANVPTPPDPPSIKILSEVEKQMCTMSVLSFVFKHRFSLIRIQVKCAPIMTSSRSCLLHQKPEHCMQRPGGLV